MIKKVGFSLFFGHEKNFIYSATSPKRECRGITEYHCKSKLWKALMINLNFIREKEMLSLDSPLPIHSIEMIN